MHAKIDSNQQILVYPIEDIRSYLPELSLPVDLTNDDLLPEGFVYINPANLPVYDAVTHRVEIGTPELVDGKWMSVFVIVSLSTAELEAAAKQLQQSVTAQVQKRLDSFAQTRGYDSMLSACTYATSKVERLSAEGQYCVDARDNTWEILFGILNEVIAGTRTMPRSFSDIESELPELAWPV